jgi:hypothetical protein
MYLYEVQIFVSIKKPQILGLEGFKKFFRQLYFHFYLDTAVRQLPLVYHPGALKSRTKLNTNTIIRGHHIFNGGVGRNLNCLYLLHQVAHSDTLGGPGCQGGIFMLGRKDTDSLGPEHFRFYLLELRQIRNTKVCQLVTAFDLNINRCQYISSGYPNGFGIDIIGFIEF